MNKLYWVALAFLIIGFLLKRIQDFSGSSNEELSNYKRKKFLFESKAELDFYKILVDLYSSNYVMFTQVSYAKLLEPKEGDYNKKRSEHSRIDRKSADFVICDKNTVAPILVIELDGPTHEYRDKTKRRDKFINEISNVAGLPLLRINVQDLSIDKVKQLVDAKIVLNNNH